MVVVELLFYLAFLGALSVAPLVLWLMGVVALGSRKGRASST
jgi:hypothetical protein